MTPLEYLLEQMEACDRVRQQEDKVYSGTIIADIQELVAYHEQTLEVES